MRFELAPQIIGGLTRRAVQFSGAVTRRPGDERLDRLAVKPECAADPKCQELISPTQPVNDGRADAETGCDFANGQEPLVRTGIRRHLAHHRRTKRRLKVSAFCHAIRTGRVHVAGDFRRLARRHLSLVGVAL